MLLRGTAIVSLLTLLSRLLGFIRDLLVAKLLGASLFADAFFVAFRIPNLLRSFVAEGALTSAFTPVFSNSLTQGVTAARDTMKRVLGFMIIITTILTGAMLVWAPAVVQFIAPGFQTEIDKFDLCVQLTRTMAPYIMCISVIAMLNAALNALNIFGTSAFAQVVMNVVLIIGAVAALPLDMTSAVTVLSVSVLLGGIIQISTQIPACRKSGLSMIPSWRIVSRDVADVVRLMVPATLGASIYQITIFFGTILASLLPSGSVSWLFYADRVAQFPIGIFSVALASVLLPTLSNASARADEAAFSSNISNSLRFTSFCIIPMSCGIWALALPITELLFERGAFDHESSVRTADALKALCLGLWATSCHSMLVRAFIARRDTLTPTLVGASSLAVYLISSLVCIGPLELHDDAGFISQTLVLMQRSLQSVIPFSANMGHTGLAAASSIAATFSLALVLLLFYLKVGRFPWSQFVLSTVRALIASLVMVIIIERTSTFYSSPLIACTAGIMLGVVSFTIMSHLLKSRELGDLATMIRSKMLRS